MLKMQPDNHDFRKTVAAIKKLYFEKNVFEVSKP